MESVGNTSCRSDYFQVQGKVIGLHGPFHAWLLTCISSMFDMPPAKIIEPRCAKNWSSGFSTRCDTNRAVQLQKMARGLKFRI